MDLDETVPKVKTCTLTLPINYIVFAVSWKFKTLIKCAKFVGADPHLCQ